MPTQVGLMSGTSGDITFYSDYAEARDNASSGDTIQVWADLDEEILLKDGVNVWVAPGRILDRTTAGPTVTDGGRPIVSTLSGNAIIKNSYETTIPTIEYFECINISNSESSVIVKCDEVRALGNPIDTIQGPTINIQNAKSFSLYCNEISNKSNSCIFITECNRVIIDCLKIESGYDGENVGAPVISNSCVFSEINAQQIICNGFGSCIVHKDGVMVANSLKVTTKNSGTTSAPTILIGDGSGTQIMNLNFDELQNLNDIGGDTIKVDEGRINFVGRRIFSLVGFTLDIQSDAT